MTPTQNAPTTGQPDPYREAPSAEVTAVGRFHVTTTAAEVEIRWHGGRLTHEEEWRLAIVLMLVIPFVTAAGGWLLGGLGAMVGAGFAGVIVGVASAQTLAWLVNRVVARLPRVQRNRLLVRRDGWRYERLRLRTRAWSGTALRLRALEHRENVGATRALGQRVERLLAMDDMPVGFGGELSDDERDTLSRLVERAAAQLTGLTA